MRAAGRITDLRCNRDNDANVVFRPAQMTSDELTEGYLRLWRDFYRGKDHLKSLARDERTIQF